MATNHVITVMQKSGKGSSSNLKTSAKRSVTQMRFNNTSKMNLGKIVAKSTQALNPNSLGVNNLKRMGIVGGITYAGVQLANKALEIGLDIHSASTGNQLAVGNIRRTKNYVLNPAKYFIDDIYKYGFLQQRITNRQNESNAYYRELTGKSIVGNQYGEKR